MFDLNIENYSKNELENLLDIESPYSLDTVNEKIRLLKQQIHNDYSQDVDTASVGIFLDELVNKLNVTNLVSNTELYPNTNIINDPLHSIRNDNNTGQGRTVLGSAGDVLPGIINPIKHRTISKTVQIDSKFRHNYAGTYASDFIIEIDKIDNVLSMGIDFVEYPLSVYNIRKGINDKFEISGVLVTLNEGIYGLANSGFAATRGNLISNINASIKRAHGGEDISNITARENFAGKIIFDSSTNDFSMNFDVESDKKICQEEGVVFQHMQTKLGWLFGFKDVSYTSDVSSIMSDGVANIANPRYIYLCIDDYTNNTHTNFTSAYNTSVNKNVMTQINYSSELHDNGAFHIVTHSCAERRTFFGPVDIQKLRIYFIDEFGNRVNFNGLDWSVNLNFEIIYGNN